MLLQGFTKILIEFYKESRSKISVEMTALQYAELVSLFEWHKANFNKDLEDMKRTSYSHTAESIIFTAILSPK